jgi:hypothetical protein
MTYLTKNLKIFLEQIKTNIIYVYIDNTESNFKEKSNYWIFKIIQKMIAKTSKTIKLKMINNLNDSNLKDGDSILLLDDCIYSGEQMKLTISNMLNSNYLKLNIHLFVSFMSLIGLNKILNEFKENDTLNNYCSLVLCDNIYYLNKTTNFYLTDKEIVELEEIYGNLFKIKNLYLIYFDHKLADYYSTITLIYSGLLANENNKNLLLEINKKKKERVKMLLNTAKINKDIKELENKLEYLEFINNCEGIRNFDMLSPKCPVPPYKTEKYNDFLVKYKKYTKIKEL